MHRKHAVAALEKERSMKFVVIAELAVTALLFGAGYFSITWARSTSGGIVGYTCYVVGVVMIVVLLITLLWWGWTTLGEEHGGS